jgi:hypothetical protein
MVHVDIPSPLVIGIVLGIQVEFDIDGIYTSFFFPFINQEVSGIEYGFCYYAKLVFDGFDRCCNRMETAYCLC